MLQRGATCARWTAGLFCVVQVLLYKRMKNYHKAIESYLKVRSNGHALSSSTCHNGHALSSSTCHNGHALSSSTCHNGHALSSSAYRTRSSSTKSSRISGSLYRCNYARTPARSRTQAHPQLGCALGHTPRTSWPVASVPEAYRVFEWLLTLCARAKPARASPLPHLHRDRKSDVRRWPGYRAARAVRCARLPHHSAGRVARRVARRNQGSDVRSDAQARRGTVPRLGSTPILVPPRLTCPRPAPPSAQDVH
jgi:hypothetical protein